VAAMLHLCIPRLASTLYRFRHSYNTERKYITINFVSLSLAFRGTCQSTWLRHYATSRKVAGSIPDEIIGIFQFT
jgi:hypothetical protein